MKRHTEKTYLAKQLELANCRNPNFLGKKKKKKRTLMTLILCRHTVMLHVQHILRQGLHLIVLHRFPLNMVTEEKTVIIFISFLLKCSGCVRRVCASHGSCSSANTPGPTGAEIREKPSPHLVATVALSSTRPHSS